MRTMYVSIRIYEERKLVMVIKRRNRRSLRNP